MNPHGVRGDPVLDALRGLPAHDVDDIRAHRLRRQCRAVLAPNVGRTISSRGLAALPWRRVLGPALMAVCGALYVVETLRQALAIYRP